MDPTIYLNFSDSSLNLQLIIFRYPNEVDTVTWTWNQTHGAKSVLWLTLAQPFSRASIEYLPVYTPSSEEKENPTLYASNVSLCVDFKSERFFSLFLFMY